MTSSVLHLPDDVLHLIVCKLRSLVCHAAFRSVCKTWRLFAQQHYSYLVPPQPPWLIFPAHATASTTYNFYTFDGVRQFFDVEVPEEYTIGRGSGTWLTFWDTKVERVRVWNPLSSIHILLPSIPGTETILKKFDKFVVSTPGPLIKNNMIFGVFYKGEKLAYIKLGQERWTHVEVDFLHQPPVVPSLEPEFKIHDIVFYQGKLHVVDRSGMVFVCEEDAHAPHYNDHHRRCPVKAVKLIDHLHDKIQKINHEAVITMLYLVEVKGRLMVLLRYKAIANDSSSLGWSFFKVDFSKRNLRSTKDLEGHSLFLSGGDASMSTIIPYHKDSVFCKVNEGSSLMNPYSLKCKFIVSGYIRGESVCNKHLFQVDDWNLTDLQPVWIIPRTTTVMHAQRERGVQLIRMN
ncbi:hypothetical protein Scep_006408 [Stephania cephalantha]|uniref:F-box domain-containing protein n=1 Tax=Stephania cephalantha TaxID=152367 RepID=A0AAP0K7Y6_9MAGN